MLFNSFDFIVFFPIAAVIFFVVPRKLRNIWLLLASYYFYMSWNPKYIVLILFSTVITYFSGLGIDVIGRRWEKSRQDNWRKCCVGISVCANLSMLFFSNI